MSYIFYAIGKLRKTWASAAVEEYLRRLQPRPGALLVPVIPRGKKSESAALLAASAGCFRIVLDRRGELLTSSNWADGLQQLELDGHQKVAFLVGGAEGHDQDLLQQADLIWSFGRLTLPHELALVVAVEQLYRACSIRANSPYHRA